MVLINKYEKTLSIIKYCLTLSNLRLSTWQLLGTYDFITLFLTLYKKTLADNPGTSESPDEAGYLQITIIRREGGV